MNRESEALADKIERCMARYKMATYIAFFISVLCLAIGVPLLIYTVLHLDMVYDVNGHFKAEGQSMLYTGAALTLAPAAFLLRSGVIFRFLKVKRLAALPNLIRDNRHEIVWLYKQRYTEYTEIVFCDNRGKKYFLRIMYNKKELENEIFEECSDLLPACMVKIDEKTELTEYYKAKPQMFYHYATYLYYPEIPQPTLSLEQARSAVQNKGAYGDVVVDSPYVLNEKQFRLVMGCTAMYRFNESLLEIYCTTRDIEYYRDASPIFFAEAFYSIDKMANHYTKQIRQRLIEEDKRMLVEDWGIKNHADWERMLQWLQSEGQRASFNPRSVAHIPELSHVTTSAGFDIARYANLVCAGFTVGYIKDMRAANPYIEKAYHLFCKYFDHYDDFVDSYLAGIYSWDASQLKSRRESCADIYRIAYSPWNQLRWK